MRESRPSDTAQVVARGVMLTACDPRLEPIVPPAMKDWTARFLAACPAGGERRLRLLETDSYRRLQYLLERATIPGIAIHYVLRKRHIEEETRRMLAEGIEQVLILGAGFDTLGVRLSGEFPDRTFIEIDHPATQRIKRSVLERSDDNRPNLHLLPLDLTTGTVQSILEGSGVFDPTRSLLLIAEGLTMYLPENDVREIFRFLHERSSSGSGAIFTYMETGPDGNAHFPAATWIVSLWLRIKGEPFDWGIMPEHLEGFMRELGFDVAANVDTLSLAERHMTGEQLNNVRPAPGELICTVRKSS